MFTSIPQVVFIKFFVLCENILQLPILCVYPHYSNVIMELNDYSQVMVEYKETLDEILGDPLLSDLSPDVTLEELQSRLTLESGQAMTVIVKRADADVYPVIVSLNATVTDLKKAIEQHIHIQQCRAKQKQTISWRYVWKSYWLVFDGVKLKDSNMLLKDLGLFNRCEVHFVKRLRLR